MKTAQEIFQAYLERDGLVLGGSVPVSWMGEELWFSEGEPGQSVILSEPYLDLPQKNRAGYDDADLIQQAAKVKRPLMIVTGTRYNLVTSSAMKMTRALIEAGIDHEFVIVPGATHHFVGAEEDYLLRKITGFFDRSVKNRAVNS